MTVEGILAQCTNVDFMKEDDGTYILWCKVCKASITSSGMTDPSFEPHAKAFASEHDRCSPGIIPSKFIF
jgi:hypothetical protein